VRISVLPRTHVETRAVDTDCAPVDAPIQELFHEELRNIRIDGSEVAQNTVNGTIVRQIPVKDRATGIAIAHDVWVLIVRNL